MPTTTTQTTHSSTITLLIEFIEGDKKLRSAKQTIHLNAKEKHLKSDRIEFYDFLCLAVQLYGKKKQKRLNLTALDEINFEEHYREEYLTGI